MHQSRLFEPTASEIDAQIRAARSDAQHGTRDWTVEVIVKKMIADEVYVPDYQRPFSWPPTSQSKYIESLLLDLPVNYVFLCERTDGRLEIVDGSQRLGSLRAFMTGKLQLTGLERLDILNDFTFESLSPTHKRLLQNKSIRAIVFTTNADETTRFDVFQRINAEGMRLTDAQIRHGAMNGPFYEVVTRCAAKHRFAVMCPRTNRSDPEGERDEMVLRFFAYRERYQRFVHDVARFLNEYVKEQNGNPDLDVGGLERDFDAMVDYVDANFPYGFRKERSKEVPRVRFEAISVGVDLALRSGCLKAKPTFEWLAGDLFKELTRTDASNSGPKLRNRIEYVRDQLIA